MRFSLSTAVLVALAADTAVANTSLSKAGKKIQNEAQIMSTHVRPSKLTTISLQQVARDRAREMVV